MPKITDRSALIDGLLKLIAVGGVTAAAIIAPNSLQFLGKPLNKYLIRLDKKARERELKRTLSYLKYSKLITEDYEHGLALTAKAKHRLQQISISELTIPKPNKWDKCWRIIFFDIPESKKTRRDAFAAQVRQLGFKVLQRSVFIHPYPCQEQVATLTEYFRVSKYVSYIETAHIDNESILYKRFKDIL